MRLGLRALSASVVSLLLLAACEEEAQVKEEVIRPVRAMQVQEEITLEETWLPGVAKATQETDLAFEVAGKLIQRPVFVGTEVVTGEVLAQLDPRDYENDLATAVAERDRAASYLDRIRQAVRSGAVARQELTDAQARFDQATAQVKIRQKAVDDTVIKAPFDGVISLTYKENFDNVRAKEPVVRVVDIQPIEFVVNVPESIIAYVRSATNVRVKFDQYPDVIIAADVKEIATEPSETTRTYPIVLIMEQPPGITILPGMAGRATGDGDLPEEVVQAGVIVPVMAIKAGKTPTASTVWVIDEATKTVAERPVTTGELTDKGILVTEGLESGEWIATAGVHYLEQGQQVRILEDRGGDR